jgi:hypothetical protein
MALLEAGIETISLDTADFDLWLDAKEAFGKKKSMELTSLASKLGSIAQARRLVNLGLVTIEGSAAKQTGVQVEQRQRASIKGDTSGHYGFDVEKMSKHKSPTDKSKPPTSSKKPKTSSREKVVSAIASFSKEEGTVFRAALSTVDWGDSKYMYRIRIRETVYRCSLADVKADKQVISAVLEKVGINVTGEEANLYVPRLFKEFKP